MKLYVDAFRISPFAFSCQIAVREKSVPCEIVDVALHKGENHTPAFREVSVTEKIPALQYGSLRLSESSAIVEYLDENFSGPSLLPRNPEERARARMVMAWLRSDLGALREDRPTTTMFYEKARAPMSAAGRDATQKLLTVADRLIFPGSTTLFSTWTIADADLAFMLHRLILNDEPVPEKIALWAKSQWKRPSIQEYVNHKRPAFVAY